MSTLPANIQWFFFIVVQQEKIACSTLLIMTAACMNLLVQLFFKQGRACIIKTKVGTVFVSLACAQLVCLESVRSSWKTKSFSLTRSTGTFKDFGRL